MLSLSQLYINMKPCTACIAGISLAVSYDSFATGSTEVACVVIIVFWIELYIFEFDMISIYDVEGLCQFFHFFLL